MTKRLLVALLVLASFVGVTSAHAGQGASQTCDDEMSQPNEVPILSTPVTLGLEGNVVGYTYLFVCYSTTSYGSPAPAVTGGRIFVGVTDGDANCTPDNSPIVVAVDCDLNDPDPSGPGNTFRLTIRVQETTVPTGDLGAEAGTPDTVGHVCLRGFTVYGPTGTVAGPFDIGVC